MGLGSLLFAGLISAGQSDVPLSPDEKIADQEMSNELESTFKPAKQQLMDELLHTKIRSDSPNSEKFRSEVQIECNQVKFDTSRLLVSMKKWGQIKILLQANGYNKNIKWAENCEIKLYIGFDGCSPDGKMLLFKTSCTCAMLPAGEEQAVLFFLPGDVRKRYKLARVPDYCAIRFSVDGVSQPIIIINKDGKNTYLDNAHGLHRETKKRSHVRDRIMRNVDQLPIYADISVPDHPTLLLEVDA
ncbi:MAG: hypothetical protein LBN94_02720 [Puniceicoccales bacterium]|nr:hypothetical protein [Puniceicoccales bacterium]